MIQALDRGDLDTFLKSLPLASAPGPASAAEHVGIRDWGNPIDDTYEDLPGLAHTSSEDSTSRSSRDPISEDTLASHSASTSFSSPPTVTTQPRNSPAPALGCACLAACYLTLDDIRGDNELSFPSGLHVLRKSMATATQMAHCQSCPTRYLSALQNVQLLIALIMTMAKQYGSVLDSIDKEARTASDLNKSKLFRFGDVESGAGQWFTLEATPIEWRSLANRSVNSEVFGVRDGGGSFWALLEFLEKRQRLWHAAPPNSDHPRDYTLDPEPLCIKLIREAKRVLEGLKF